jgi:hypothetical protein
MPPCSSLLRQKTCSTLRHDCVSSHNFILPDKICYYLLNSFFYSLVYIASNGGAMVNSEVQRIWKEMFITGGTVPAQHTIAVRGVTCLRNTANSKTATHFMGNQGHAKHDVQIYH